METQYFKDYSFTLGRDMEMKVYGHGGDRKSTRLNSSH